MRKLLKEAVARQASDLHLTVGAPPFLRLHGEIALMGEEPLTPETCKALISEVINQEQMAEFEREWELSSFHTNRLTRRASTSSAAASSS